MSSKKQLIRPDEVTVAQRLVSTFNSAKKRSKNFNLSMKYLSNIVHQTHCAYSGELFDNNIELEKMTLERFDNDRGYVEGNVIPVKMKYNTMRSSYTLEELIQKRDELAGRIVRSSDANMLVVEDPTGKDITQMMLPKHRGQYINLLNNIRNREKHLNNIKKDDAELRKSLMARIAGGYAELERLKKSSLAAAAKASASVIKINKATKAEESFHMYDIIVKGLTRFENLTKLDRAKLNKGLPLSASIFQFIKGAM